MNLFTWVYRFLTERSWPEGTICQQLREFAASEPEVVKPLTLPDIKPLKARK